MLVELVAVLVTELKVLDEVILLVIELTVLDVVTVVVDDVVVDTDEDVNVVSCSDELLNVELSDREDVIEDDDRGDDETYSLVLVVSAEPVDAVVVLVEANDEGEIEVESGRDDME